MERLPQKNVPAMVEVPFTLSVQVPGQYTDPSSQCLITPPVMANCPVLLEGAQINTFQHARSPTVHQADPGHAAASAAPAPPHRPVNQGSLGGCGAATLG